MSRTVLVAYDCAGSKKNETDVERVVIDMSTGECVEVGPGLWLFRTKHDMGEVAARMGGLDGGADRWMAVNVSNRIYAWANQKKDAHAYMSAINKALQKAPRR